MLIKRRNVLGSLGGMAMMPMLMETLKAQEPGASGTILVTIYLQGGNDGLNTVIPLPQYSQYYKLRTPATPPPGLNMAYALDDLQLVAFDADYTVPPLSANEYAFAPAMLAMRDLYTTGKLAVINGVGLPLTEMNGQSHSNATMDWMTGQINIGLVQPNGWLGLTMDGQAAGSLGAATSMSGNTPLLIGNTTRPLVVNPPIDYFGASYGVSDDQSKLISAYKFMSTNPALSAVGLQDQGVEDTALADISIVQSIANKNKAKTYPTPTWLDYQLRDIARMIEGGSGVRAFFAEQGGYDTHSSQATYQPTLLAQLGEAIVNFYEYLAALNLSSNVLIMTLSDFGRRPYANLDFGTDHGAASTSFVFGDMVKGGVYSSYPSLKSFDPNGNMKVNVDFRIVLYELITAMGGNASSIVGSWTPLGFL